MRVASRSEAGWRKNVYRTAARHRSGKAPGVVKVPETWWRSSPAVGVRRLGLRLDLDLRDNLQRTLYFTGTYEPALVAFLRRELRTGDVFVDAGAHIGVHSLTAARHLRKLGGGAVIAFEPAADSVRKLRHAAARNGLEVTVVEAALASAVGEGELYGRTEYEPADAGVRSRSGDGHLVQRVRLVTFDGWASGHGLGRLDLVKLDVEGGERDALEGMRESLRRWRPRAVVVELKDSDDRPVRDLLRELGYEATGEVFFSANELFRPR
jgi:FkbM family methyltransferase